MPTEQKKIVVDQLTDKFENCRGIYFANYTGLDVIKATKLRKLFKEKSVEFYISKNTLTKIAAKNAGHSNIFDKILSGQIGIAYALDDPIDPARIIKEFNDNNDDVLDVTGIFFEGVLYNSDKFTELAKLPMRDELIAKFASAINQPMTKLALALNSSMSKMVQILSTLKDKK